MAEKNEEQKPEQAEAAPEQPKQGSRELPPASFIGFLRAMASQTLIHLGVIPSPVTRKTERHLEEAKFSIDLLEIIRDKTKGNLTDEERKFLDAILADLQVVYVKAAAEK